MTFTPKSFTPLDTLPALDLNEMDANIDHVREEANYYHIGTFPLIEYVTAANISVRLLIDTTPVGTLFTTSGAKSEADIALAGFSDGLHVLSFKTGPTGITEVGPSIRFYKSPDMDYLTYWVTVGPAVGSSPTINHSLSNFTALGHRESPKSWT